MDHKIMIEFPRVLSAFQTARRELLALRVPAGHWVGELSGSPFATASAAGALAIAAKQVQEDARREAYQQLAARAVEWLVARQMSDGGSGDTPSGPANLAATWLVRAAIHLAGQAERFADALAHGQRYIDGQGGLAGLRRQYAADRALLAAVLGTSALAGITPWRDVPPMAFETCWLPRSLQKPRGAAAAHVEPIRVGMGQARFLHRWPRNPFALVLRRLSVGRSLAALAEMQSPGGGFLESAAWTGFFLMGMASTGRAEHPLARRAISFVLDTVRSDASWPIVTNRGIGNTALAVNALASASGDVGALGCLDWLLNAQRSRENSPAASSGGWAWHESRGIMPDVDDTAAALLALSVLLRSGTDAHRPRVEAAATAGINWLLSVQNRDGGWPTCFRGADPDSLDGSGPCTTAHAMRALHIWQYWTTGNTIDEALRRGFYYLSNTQRPDGTWRTRWFGNIGFPGGENPIYGTSQVVLAYGDLNQTENRIVKRGLEWLAAAVDPDGGWGGGTVDPRGPSSIEETAMAVEALLVAPDNPRWRTVLQTGLEWLVRAVEESRSQQPAIIGLHPPQLWYAERAYPLIFTVSALGQAVKLLSRPA